MVSLLGDCCCEELVFYSTNAPYVRVLPSIVSEFNGSGYVFVLYFRYRIEVVASSGTRWIDTSYVSDYTYQATDSYDDDGYARLEALSYVLASAWLSSYAPALVVYVTFNNILYKHIFDRKIYFTADKFVIQCVYNTYKVL